MDKWDRPKDDKAGAGAAAKSKTGVGGDPVVIQWRIDTWFPDLPPEVKTKLKGFHDELLKFNKTMDLISVKTLGHADALHFADSILASRAIFASMSIDEIYDFGSGNGFPGLVFSILFPKVKVHLVELDSRKAEFLKNCITVLKLTNTDVMIRAVEALPPNSVKFGMSRGLASIAKAILSTRKTFVKGGRYFHLKGEEWASEVAGIPTQLCSFWTPGLVGEYKLPVGEVKFAVVKTEKIAD